MEDRIAHAREILRAEVDKLRSQLTELDRQRNEIQASLTTAERGLHAMEGRPHSGSPIVITGINPNQFRGKNTAQAMLEYLELQKREVSLEEMTEALMAGNADLGSVPGREKTLVKISVTTNPHLLTLKGNMVTKAAPGTPKPERKKRRK